MTTMMKRLITSAGLLSCCLLAAAANAAGPTTLEYPYLFKSPRAMGMGGAYVAVGGRADSLFYNPAALINIPRDKGWEVSLINVAADVGKNTTKFVKDLRDALDAQDENNNGRTGDDQLKAVNDVLAKYQGANLHLLVSDFTSLAKSSDSYAFGVGGVAVGRMDATPHEGMGSDGLLEMNLDTTYGGVGGASIRVADGWYAGVGVKALSREGFQHSFTALDLVENQEDLSNYIQDDLLKRGSAVGFDAGVLWKFQRESWWRPSAGLSALNIGDLDFKEAGKVPMTVNAGFSVNPQINWSRSLIVGVDYVDITNNYPQDTDMLKRLRAGAELQLFDIMPVEMAVRAGLYEGYPAFGADLRLLTFAFSYTMYSEELGAYAGQAKDTRQMVTFNFGW